MAIEQVITNYTDNNPNPNNAQKLTNWVNEPSVTKLKEDLEGSKPTHDAHILKVQRWNDLHKVTGQSAPPKVKGRSQVQPKLIRRQAEWRYSALTEPFLGSEKMFDVKPTTFEDTDAAKQNTIVLNWQFRTKFNRVKLIDDYVRTAVDEGAVIVRLGWCRYTKMEPKTVPVWTYMQPTDPEQIKMLEAAVQLKTDNPHQYNDESTEELKAAVDYFLETNTPNIAVQTGTEEIKVEKIIDNRPTIDFINPENHYVDPSCGGDLDKAHFQIISFETSQAELKKEPKRYKNLDKVNWETATIIVANEHAQKSVDNNFNFKDLLRKRVVAYEYWGLYDIHNNGILVPIVATWIGDVLVRCEENPFPDGKAPFVIASYMPIKRELMGEPDAELLEDNQKILGAVSRGMIDLLGRSANAQQGFAKGMLDTLNRRRFENGQDYEFNPNMPTAMGFVEHKYPEIPQSAMLMLQLQNNEAEALTGVKAFSGGMSGDSYGDVAAGIRGVLDAASKREMAILRRLAQGWIDVGKKIIAMNQQFFSEEETVRITNTKFVKIKREELAGQFDLEVDISTAEIDNAKAQDLGFMLQTIGNNMDFNITKIILSEIASLKRMPELAHKIEQFEPQPDPIQQELAQLEVEKIKKEIAELDSRIALNKAKVAETTNKADNIDLKTTEDETGTTHERNLELARAQSEGNTNLEITKSLLKPRKPEETKPDIDAAIGYKSIAPKLDESRRPAAPVRPNIPEIPIVPQQMPIDPNINTPIQM